MKSSKGKQVYKSIYVKSGLVIIKANSNQAINSIINSRSINSICHVHQDDQMTVMCLLNLDETVGVKPANVDEPAASVVKHEISVSSSGLIDKLTAKERDILKLMSQGMSNKDIAEHMILSPGTIKWYTNKIYSKLGVTNRTEAVYQAWMGGIISKHNRGCQCEACLAEKASMQAPPKER